MSKIYFKLFYFIVDIYVNYDSTYKLNNKIIQINTNLFYIVIRTYNNHYLIKNLILFNKYYYLYIFNLTYNRHIHIL